ncbi:hypothetical protein [Bacillus sp. JJ1566]
MILKEVKNEPAIHCQPRICVTKTKVRKQDDEFCLKGMAVMCTAILDG